MMYEYQKNELGLEDKDIPLPYKVVEAEVIKAGTSLAVRKQLAGEHESAQHDSHHGAAADILAAFMRASREKKLAFGTTALTDKEVLLVVADLGLNRDKSFDQFRLKKPEESLEKFQKKQVCVRTIIVCLLIDLLFRPTTLSPHSGSGAHLPPVVWTCRS